MFLMASTVSPGMLPITIGTVWVGETKPPPELLAEALDAERRRHPSSCPRSIAACLCCICTPGQLALASPVELV